MIELKGIYKLKKMKGFKSNDTSDYKVIALLKNKIVVCENQSSEKFYFMKDFLIDPEFPDYIYSNIKILELS